MQIETSEVLDLITRLIGPFHCRNRDARLEKFRQSALMQPEVSVIMSVYNGGRYLPLAMDSLLAQTFSDFELLVMDDGSTDRSLSILNTYANKDGRVKVYSQPNAGLTVSLNRLAAKSTARLLARMDPDDISLPARLERQVAMMEIHPEVVVMGTSVGYMDEYGVVVDVQVAETDHDKIMECLLQGRGGAIRHPSVIIRRCLFEQIKGYDERYRTSQDLDLFLRLAEIGRLSNVAEVLLHYREHLQSTNSQFPVRQVANARQIVFEARTRRGLPSSPTDVKDWPAPPRHEQMILWGRAALRNGRTDVAFKYALRALRERPFCSAPYRFLVRAVLGH